MAKKERVEKNYKSGGQLFQLEQAVRVMFLPDFNVWQVHKMDMPTYQQLRFEVVGHQNSNVAFDFAMLYVKYFKYDLDDSEMARIKDAKYTFDEADEKLKKRRK